MLHVAETGASISKDHLQEYGIQTEYEEGWYCLQGDEVKSESEQKEQDEDDTHVYGEHEQGAGDTLEDVD